LVIRARRTPVDHRPLGRRERTITAVGYRGLQTSVVISLALIFGLGASESRSPWLAGVRIALGMMLLVEGNLLGTNWLGARRLTVWRVQHRPSRKGDEGSAAVRFLVDVITQLAGVVWLGVGSYLVWLGAAALF
jgi:hypothetical protein